MIGLLSNVNLEEVLGKHIGIFPLDFKSIEGASIDLTASKYAYSVSKKKSVVSGDRITIDPKDTVIVFTQETIFLDEHYAGACYNRISFSMKGLIHASSPIKPNYIGRFSVALYNASLETIVIKVKDPIVVVMFHKLDKPATVSRGNGKSSRLDLLQSLGITIQNEKTRHELTQYDDRDSLFETMKKCESYKRIEKKRAKKRAIAIAMAVGIGQVIIGSFLIGFLWKQLDQGIKQLFLAVAGTVIAAEVLAFISYLKSNISSDSETK